MYVCRYKQEYITAKETTLLGTIEPPAAYRHVLNNGTDYNAVS